MSTERPARRESLPRENVGARRLGRAGFVGVVGAGVATLFYGKSISHVTSTVTNPVSDATGLTKHRPVERLADLHRRRHDAALRPGHLAAPDRRARRAARRARPTTSCSPCRRPSRSRRSTASPAGSSTTSTGRGVRFHDLLAEAEPLPQAAGAAFRLGRAAVRRLPRRSTRSALPT